jgi:hypothetical protein
MVRIDGFSKRYIDKADAPILVYMMPPGLLLEYGPTIDHGVIESRIIRH